MLWRAEFKNFIHAIATIYVYVYIYIHTCVYIYIYAHPPTTRKNAHFAHLSRTVIRQRLRKSKNPKIQKSKNPKLLTSTESCNCFWIFGFLDFWVLGLLDF